MIIKIKSCLYCEQEMESITAKKRFCSDKCRVYYNRENKHYNGGKSNPIGVRFDTYKLDMIQKEQNLTSIQQVVNYLMDNYGKIKPVEEVLVVKPIECPKKVQKPVELTLNSQPEPPSNLKGIDLAIWKSENWK
jgi:hypothetical protein